MKYAILTVIILIVLALATHTTVGIYNDNYVQSFGMGNTHIGFSVGKDNGKLFYNYHLN